MSGANHVNDCECRVCVPVRNHRTFRGRIDEDTFAELKAESRRLNVPVTEIVGQAVEEYFLNRRV